SNISTSQVYPFLNILEKNRLVKVSRFGERDKKVYELTRKGEKFVNGFLQRSGNLLHRAIELKLTACAHCGCKVYEGGHIEKIRRKKLAFCCNYCATSFKKEMHVV
ncbi:MAG: helix-turn-helix transcriptional regulator, partial [Nitrososphaerales archaeon]